MNKSISLAFVLLSGSVLTSSALTFHEVMALAAPNMTDGNPGGNPLTNIIEGAGIGFELDFPHARLGGTWYSDAPGGFPSDYIDSNPGDETIILDLGADTTLYELSYWGYSIGNGNGLREFDVRFATDVEGGDAALGDEAFGTSITANPSFTALLAESPRQSFSFGGPVTARYVEIKAVSNYFNIIVGGDRLGIGEFSFAIPTAVGAPDIFAQPEAILELDPTMTTTHVLPLVNTGDTDLVISAIDFTGPNGAALSVLTQLPVTLPPFSTGPVEVQFDSTGLGEAISATATLTSSDPDSGSVDILLTGTLPILAADLAVLPEVDLVLNETMAQDYPITVTNSGGAVLTISGVTFIGADGAAFSLVSQPGALAKGESGDIVIRFNPEGAKSGAVDATMRIASDDGDSPETDVILNGGLTVEFTPIARVLTNTTNFYSEFNLIGGSGVGFEAIWPHASIGTGDVALWVTDAPNGGTGDYFDNAQPAPVIIFDLGSNVTLGEIFTWGYDAGNANGGKDFSLRFATDAEGGGAELGDENFGNSITFAPSFEAAFDPIRPVANRFEQQVSARYVEMTFTDNWQGLVGTVPGGDRVGLGEAAFPLFPGGLDRFLAVIGTEVLGNGQFAITFFTTPGITYGLERSTDGLVWDRLPDTVTSGAEDFSTITDSNPLAGENVVLYRLIHPGR